MDSDLKKVLKNANILDKEHSLIETKIVLFACFIQELRDIRKLLDSGTLQIHNKRE